MESAQPQVQNPDRFTGHAVHLNVFEGPLDLLLYLIRAHRADISEVSIREITGQFIEYLTLMNEIEADYAGDFLVTAATLMQIKARGLLPKSQSENEDVLNEEPVDASRELVERLLQYQGLQDAALQLQERREARADLFARSNEAVENSFDWKNHDSFSLADSSSFDLLSALRRVLKRLEAEPVALVRREPFSLAQRLQQVQNRLSRSEKLTFDALCDDCQERLEVVITFLAVLELVRRGRVRVRQSAIFDEIWLEAA
jgi:segregation and condensation protein A